MEDSPEKSLIWTTTADFLAAGRRLARAAAPTARRPLVVVSRGHPSWDWFHKVLCKVDRACMLLL